MAANVESMFSVRVTPWHGLGEIVKEALTSDEALRKAGLDWMVENKPIFTGEGIEIPGYMANIRDSDGQILGVVSNRYQVVQNMEAFSFTDNLIGKDVRYETAGSLANGKRIWLLAKIPDSVVLGDKIENFLVFSNSHDGTSAIRVAFTPVRVVCQNTLNLALRNATRMWSTRHTGDMSSKLYEAQRTLEIAGDYMKEFNAEAEELAKIKVTRFDIKKVVDNLIPLPLEKPERMEEMQQKLYKAIQEPPDLGNFRNTAWGVLNGVSDFATHTRPLRVTSRTRERMFESTINGNQMIDTAYKILKEVV